MREGDEVVGLLKIMRDTTEQKRTEQELEVSRERLDLVVNSSEVGLWYCDLPFDKLVWNAKCKEHFGLPPDAEVTIDTFYERHPPRRPGGDPAGHRAVDRRAATEYDAEFRTVDPQGRVRWVRAIGRPFFDVEGTPLRFDGITVDVTGRIEQEQALREADRRKDEFLATLAHELRNPLAPIRNALHLMRRADGRRPMEAERAMAERQVVHLARLIDDLMDVARISQGQDRAPPGGRGPGHGRQPGGRDGPAPGRRAAPPADRLACPTRRSGWRATRPGWSRSSGTC